MVGLQCLADELRTLFLFERLTAEQLDRLCTDGHIKTFPVGALYAEGEPARYFYVLIDGELLMTKRSGGAEVETVRTSQRGAYCGAFSAFVRREEHLYSASVRVVKPSRFFVLDTNSFVEFVHAEFPMAVHLLEGRVVGAQRLDQIIGQREKLLALGAMTASLTRQLNIPAATTARAVADLHQGVGNMRHSLAMVAEGRLTPETLRALVTMQDAAAEQVARQTAQDLTKQDGSDRQALLGNWLDNRGIIGGRDYARAFVEAGLDIDWLEQVSESVHFAGGGWAGEGRENLSLLQSAIELLMHTIDTELRIQEITAASRRISDLLVAAKQYSQMDRGSYQSADINELLRSTIMMFGEEVAMTGEDKPIALVKEMDDSLPEILCYPGDLNQVWTNIIDNAIHAMNGHGTLTVRSMRENDDMIRIEICDDGPGIPDDIVGRIFTPYFTTKALGEGVGLGLDLTWRIVVDKHRGTLTVQSKPGDTRFIICLLLRAPAPESPSRREPNRSES